MKENFLTSEKVANALSKMHNNKFTLEELELTKEEMDELISATGNIVYNKKEKKYYIDEVNKNNYDIISFASKKEVTERWLELSDIYFGSKFCDYDNLVAVLDWAKAKNITDVHIAGDLCAGHPKFKNQVKSLIATTAQGQADIAVELFSKYPEFKYYCINGERDLSFEKGDSINPIVLVQRELNEKGINFRHINEMEANLVIDGIVKRIHHGSGNLPYTKSYPFEKYMKKLFEKGDNVVIKKRNYNIRLVQFGHFHTDCYQIMGGIHMTSTAGMVFDDKGILKENTTYPAAKINEVTIKDAEVIDFKIINYYSSIKGKN